MDTLTHIVLGACIGEATAGKKLGKKAMVAGALAQSVPDIDFLAYFWMDKADNLLAHRGITHSLLFALLMIFLFSALTRRIFHKKNVLWTELFWLFGLNIFCHLLIDAFNAYGVGWLEPFSSVRVSFHLLFVADPLFSLWPFLAFLAILIFYRRKTVRKRAWIFGLLFPLLYVFYAWVNKRDVESDIQKHLRENGIPYQDYFITPAPFNAWLWFVAIKDGKGYFTTYRSVFDTQPVRFIYHNRNDSLLTEVKNKNEVQKLMRFALGYYTVEKNQDTISFNVLRFGKMVGINEQESRFAFYYYLDRPGANSMLVQRGRFKNWSRKTFSEYIRRICGD